MLAIFLLGPFHVTLARKAISGFESNKVRALFAYLAVEYQRPQPRTTIAGLLWPDVPETKALRNLRQALANLKKCLKDNENTVPYLNISRATIQINPSAEYSVDVRKLLDKISLVNDEAFTASSITSPKEIIDLYRGDFLSGFYLEDSEPFDEWASLKREYLHEQMVNATLELARIHQRRGEYDEMLVYARKHLALEPWSEVAHRQVIVGLSHTGRRSAAVQQFEICKGVLKRELGLEPSTETTELYQRIKNATPRHNLPPQPNQIVGRKEELAQIQALLADTANRLLTLLGPGGVGKTRLAIQLAHQRLQAYIHGIVFVPLADLNSPALLLPQIADAARISMADLDITTLLLPRIADSVGIPLSGNTSIKEQIKNFFRDKEILLILDNFEHLVESASVLSEILEAAPELNILVTSRERLRLRWENVLEIQGLSFSTQNSPAVKLFEASAKRTSSNFSLTDDMHPDAQKICELVEGLPLGIELAAAWVHNISLEKIVAEITKSLEVLQSDMRDANPRHKSTRAVFEHSWSLLEDSEQMLLQRSAIFRGTFTHEAVQKVCGNAKLLQKLVDKSLVQILEENERRYYRLHELIRQFASEKIALELVNFRTYSNNHAKYYLEILATSKNTFVQEDDFSRREIPFLVDNIRVAWKWGIENRMTQLVEASAFGLSILYSLKDWHIEALDVFSHAYNLYTSQPDKVPTPVLAHLLNGKGIALYRNFQYAQAKEVFSESVRISREVGDAEMEGVALCLLGSVNSLAGELEEGEINLLESIKIGKKTGNNFILGRANNNLGLIYQDRGEQQKEEEAFLTSIEANREQGDYYDLCKVLNNYGLLKLNRGMLDEAQELFEESLEITIRIESRSVMSISLGNLGTVAYRKENIEEAIKWYDKKLLIARDIGDQAIIAQAITGLGVLYSKLKEPAEVLGYYQEGLAIYEAIDLKWGICFANLNLGELYIKMGELDLAEKCYKRTLDLGLDIEYPYYIQFAILEYGRLAQGRSEFSEAVKLATTVRYIPELNAEILEQADKLLMSLKEKVSEKEFSKWIEVAKSNHPKDVNRIATNLL